MAHKETYLRNLRNIHIMKMISMMYIVHLHYNTYTMMYLHINYNTCTTYFLVIILGPFTYEIAVFRDSRAFNLLSAYDC